MRGRNALIFMMWMFCLAILIAGCSDDDNQQQSNECNWNIAVLDSSKKVYGAPSLFVDSDGNLHISYYSCDKVGYEYCQIGHLRYVTDVSGDWHKFVVDKKGDAGWCSSIFVEEDGTIHIAYNNYDWDSLMYAKNAQGEWQTTLVDADFYSIMDNEIGVDANGYVHILYSGFFPDNSPYYSEGGLKYASNASGEWKVYVASTDLYYRFSGTIDSTGTVHIAGSYLNELKYVKGQHGAWQSFVIDSDAGGLTDIALDSKGTVHISYDYYPDKISSFIRYATNSSGVWEIETVGEYEAEGLSLAVSEDNDVHMVFISSSDSQKQLIYAKKTSGSWSFCTIEGDISFYTQPSLALDKAWNVHVAYIAGGKARTLKHATTVNE